MKIMVGFAGAQVLVVGMLWKRKQISVVEKEERKNDKKEPTVGLD
jgi:hypothetical protein